MSVNDVEHASDSIATILARTLVGFQDQYLATWPSQGILCQSWIPTSPLEVDPEQLPDVSSSQYLVLRTKGKPFFLAGQSGADHLAFFRCISCRYTFGTDVNVPTELGAPGRVFLTCKPEVLNNVGAMAPEDFHRSNHAKTCMVRSCMILPVFAPCAPRKCLGVVEVLTNNADLAYSRMSAMVAEQLAKHGMATVEVSDKGCEGGGEISPTLRQVNVTATPFVEGDVIAKDTNFAVHDNSHNTVPNAVQPLEEDAANEGSGFVTGRDSARLGVSLADLKTLMKQKRIKTLSRNSMGRYEEEVDLVLNNVPDMAMPRVPSEKGMDSRWDAAKRLPQKRKDQALRRVQEQHKPTQQGQAQKQVRRKCMTRDFGDVAFPVVRRPDGSLVADFSTMAENEIRRQRATAGSNALHPPAAFNQHNHHNYQNQSDPIAIPGMRTGSGEMLEERGSGGFSTGALSGDNSDDWLGMIDPQMLDLMVNDNVLDAIGNIDNIQLFG